MKKILPDCQRVECDSDVLVHVWDSVTAVVGQRHAQFVDKEAGLKQKKHQFESELKKYETDL